MGPCPGSEWRDTHLGYCTEDGFPVIYVRVNCYDFLKANGISTSKGYWYYATFTGYSRRDDRVYVTFHNSQHYQYLSGKFCSAKREHVELPGGPLGSGCKTISLSSRPRTPCDHCNELKPRHERRCEEDPTTQILAALRARGYSGYMQC